MMKLRVSDHDDGNSIYGYWDYSDIVGYPAMLYTIIGRRRSAPAPIAIPFYYVDGTPYAEYYHGKFYRTLFLGDELKDFKSGIVLVKFRGGPVIMYTSLVNPADENSREWELIHSGDKVDRVKVEAFFRDSRTK